MKAESFGEGLRLTVENEFYNVTLTSGGDSFHLNERVHLQISTENDEDIMVHSCFLSNTWPVLSSNSVIIDEYAIMRNLIRTEHPDEATVRFSFQSRLLASSSPVYCRCEALSRPKRNKTGVEKKAGNLLAAGNFLVGSEGSTRSTMQSATTKLPPLLCKNEDVCSHGCIVLDGKERCLTDETTIHTKDIHQRSNEVKNTTVGVCSIGVISGEDGQLSLPTNYSLEHRGQARGCVKSIIVDMDKVIEFTVEDFWLQEKPLCASEYVEVYDGDRKIGGTRYCGGRKPMSFVSTGNNVTVSFVTERMTTESSFTFSWRTTGRCTENQFTCWNGACINGSFKCDRRKNCVDDSDEIECAKAPSSKGQCGKTKVTPHFSVSKRIVGGNEVTYGSWPWQVLLIIGDSHKLCSASIIGPWWIMTAAHCVDGQTLGKVNVYIGIHDYHKPGRAAQQVQLEKITIHPGYFESSKHGFDIALLKAQAEIVFTDYIRPVCIPPPGVEFPPGTICITAGWGRLFDMGGLPNILHQVRVPLVAFNKCNENYPSNRLSQKSHVCAGNTEKGGVDACQGDSGGPLMCLHAESTWFQVGITSFGIGCGESKYPGVYTSTHMMYDWIVKETGLQSFHRVDVCSPEKEVYGVSGEIVFSGNYSRSHDVGNCVKSIQVVAEKKIRISVLETKVEMKNRAEVCKAAAFELIENNKTEKVDICLSPMFTYVSKHNHLSIKVSSNNTLPSVRVIWEAVDRSTSTAVIKGKSLVHMCALSVLISILAAVDASLR